MSHVTNVHVHNGDRQLYVS